MDNLTHSLLGLAMGRAGLADRCGKGTTALLVVASNIPDVDVLHVMLLGQEGAWLRRTHTHCIVGGPLVALMLALIWWIASRGRMRLPAAIGLSLLGVAGHVLLDLFNSYGVVALWPFSVERFELAWVFIIDLVIFAILIAPTIFARFARRKARAYQAALAVFALYVGICAAGHWRAGRLLDAMLAAEGAQPSMTHVFPEALGPHRWRAVAREGQRWRMWLVHVLDGRIELVQDMTTADDDPRVIAARATERGRSVERFFKAPVWRVEPDGRTATCVDLRFLSAVLEPRGSFAYEFDLPRSR